MTAATNPIALAKIGEWTAICGEPPEALVRELAELGFVILPVSTVEVRPFYFDRCAPVMMFGTDTRVTAGVVYATDEAAARKQFRSVFGKEIAEVDKLYRFLDLATVTDRPHGNIAVVTVRD